MFQFLVVSCSRGAQCVAANATLLVCDCSTTNFTGPTCDIPICTQGCFNGTCEESFPGSKTTQCFCDEDYFGINCSSYNATENSESTTVSNSESTTFSNSGSTTGSITGLITSISTMVANTSNNNTTLIIGVVVGVAGFLLSFLLL